MENISLYLLEMDHTMLKELCNHGFRVINDILIFREFYPSELEQRKKLSSWGVPYEHFTKICNKIEEFLKKHSNVSLTESNVKREDILFLRLIASKHIVVEGQEKFNTMVSSSCITQVYSRTQMGKSDIW